MNRTLSLLCILGLALGCGDDDPSGDVGPADSGAGDTGRDTSAPDVGPDPDAGPEPDANVPECGADCDVLEVGVNTSAVCARLRNSEVWCWGANLFGQLGDNRMRHGDVCGMGDPDPLDCSPAAVRVRNLEATDLHPGGPGVCATTEAGLACWGLSDAPPIGTDQRIRRFEPEIVEGFEAFTAVSRGFGNTCVLTTEGGVQCIGNNDSAQVGDGSQIEQLIPIAVPGLSGVEELALSTGGEFACARNAEGVQCWGDNSSLQLGDDATHVDCGNGVITYDCSPEPVTVALEGTATQLALGSNHACALVGTDVWCWGNNSAGQLGLGTYSSSEAVPAMVPGLSATVIRAGGETTCAVTSAGNIMCWGRNDEGQLGDGETVGSHDTCSVGTVNPDCSGTPLMVDSDSTFTDVDLNVANGCGVSADGVECWGWNDQRQLGENGPMTRERTSTPVVVVVPPAM
ncbi:MAG: alpha-tubulin suppressor-like RCC1 family protein [Polyangiales bacterium]|jgi:alpha-tubulin suppressor-like RCC1 family protein